MKKRILLGSSMFITTVILFALISCGASGENDRPKTQATNTNTEQPVKTEPVTGVEMLNSAAYQKKVHDFKKNSEWKFEGSKPCVVDFYADWCGPCKRLAPIMEELAKKYAGKVNFYKVNVDFEKELANAYGITSIPAILYCPMNGQPQMSLGLYPKEEYIKIIDEFLLNNNSNPKK